MPKKVDTVQSGIVAYLRAAGASWQSMATLGKGAPDGLVGYRGIDQSAEIKTGREKLQPNQLQWHSEWRGAPVVVLRTTQDAAQLLRMMADRAEAMERGGLP